MQPQEYIMQLQMLEQEANQFGEQLQIIDQQINELKILKNNVSKFEESNENEVYSEFGKGIYFKAKIDKKEFLVDVGSKIIVPKSTQEIKEIIDDQINKFNEIKPEIELRIQEINLELDKIINKAKTQKTEKENIKPSKSEDKIIIKKRK